MNKIGIIYNPNAGTGKIKKLLKIKERLSLKSSVTIYDTQKPGDATSIAKRECKNFDIIVAAGGDGTINEVINGIDVNTKLGIIPLGTANILAIEAGIKNDVKSICKLIEKGNTKKIYISNINDKKFFLMAGIGYDGDIVHKMKPSLKKIFGKAMFGFLGLLEFFKLKKYNIKVETESETAFGNWVLVTNSKHYAGPYKITKSTSIFNDSIVCYVFNDLSRLGFLYYIFLIIFYGDLSRSKKVTKIISKNIKISSKEKINVQCDGEKYGNLPIEINFSSEVVNLLTA
ncbi:MAG: diacylglycerol kinase family lipid kinase [alpha proteobacterium HIMB114]|nr:MAG: diacylglycerol kinase family lipid kinase [alpha proteobacterium HIMB114]